MVCRIASRSSQDDAKLSKQIEELSSQIAADSRQAERRDRPTDLHQRPDRDPAAAGGGRHAAQQRGGRVQPGARPARRRARPGEAHHRAGPGIGLIGGAALGCGTVLFFAITSDKLRRRADVASALGVTVPVSVGRIAALPQGVCAGFRRWRRWTIGAPLTGSDWLRRSRTSCWLTRRPGSPSPVSTTPTSSGSPWPRWPPASRPGTTRPPFSTSPSAAAAV